MPPAPDSRARLRQQACGQRFDGPEGRARVDGDRFAVEAGRLRADTGRARLAIIRFPIRASRPPHVLAIHPQRMDVVAVTARILFQRVKIRDAAQLASHEFLVTPARRPNGRFPGKRQVRNHLSRGQRMHPIAHLNMKLSGFETQIRFDISGTVHFDLSVDRFSTHLSDKDGAVAGRTR
jgi:hypothetical protein